jgi:TRAP-type C4-dicarboxylate transport system substrate-binding protein
LCTAATADVQRLHLAAIAPEGSEWASYLRGFSEEVSRDTEERLSVKWTLGGIGGDEPTLLTRLLRRDLDGIAGAAVCKRLAPSMRALELIGFVSDDRQARAVLQGLAQQINDEFRATPFQPLFVSTGLGRRMLFSKRPVRSFTDLQRGHWWVWDLDEVTTMELREMGVPVVPLPLEKALPAAADGRVDGFIAVPSAAITFGLYTRAHWFTNLEAGYLPGCLIMNARSYEALSADDRAVLVTASVRLRNAFERAERRLEADLAGALAREGLQAAPMNANFRATWFAAGRAAVDRLGEKLVPRWLVKETRELVEMGR